MKRERFNPHDALGSVGAMLLDTAARMALFKSAPPAERHHKKTQTAGRVKSRTPGRQRREPMRHWYSNKKCLLRGKLPKNYWRDVARQSNYQNTRWMRDGSVPGDAAKYADMERRA